MKQNHLIVLIFLILMGCQDSSEPVIEDTPDGEKVSYTFNVKDLIEFDNQPIGGRTSSNELTYYLLEIQDVTNTTVEYASGVFDHLPTNISVDLYVGRDYRVYIKALRKGDTYGIVVIQDSVLRASSTGETITNRITYGSGLNASFGTNNDTYYYSTSDSSTITETLSSQSGFGGGGPKPTLLDTYLARADINQVLPIDSNIYFYMARNVFAFEATVNNLNSGALSVSISGVSKTFDATSNMTWGHTLSYGFLSSDSSLYESNMRVTVIKYDTVATVVESETLYDQNVPFKRLHRKFIDITLPQDTTAADTTGSTTFHITVDDQPIVDGDTLNIQ
ncbi:hypothetical protein [Ekhidna sp.]|uniref:hypothetical protein n=1 Tax=Ekhidna sp. TaxID=2608089 RepID=UPI003CCBB781